MAEVCIIGKTGFLGNALAKKLGDTSSFPTKNTKVLFYFGSTVHTNFELNPDYHLHQVIQDFLYFLPYCKEHNIKFIYASSALIYEKDTVFVKIKKILEILASCYSNTLGLRIFPVYGKGGHDVISKWCDEMKNDIQPTVWGNGGQIRDFIYIDDFVNQVISVMNKTGIIDIGTGNAQNFGSIVKTINTVLEKNIKPKYIKAPLDYSKGIICNNPLPTNISLEEGIRKICTQA